MAVIAAARLDAEWAGDWQMWWTACARAARGWLIDQRFGERDAVVVVPHGPHVALMRGAWMACAQPQGAALSGAVGAWVPRIGTVAAVADALGGAMQSPALRVGGITFDRGTDMLSAHVLMLGQPWARQWLARDPAGFAAGVSRLVDAAHEVARVAHARCADERAAWLDEAQAALAAATGPGLRERMLMLTALQWLAQSPPPATDVLFDCMRGPHVNAPGGEAGARPWILAGFAGNDIWRRALCRHAEQHGVPLLCVDPPDTEALSRHARHAVRQAVCDDLEDEAQRACAQVMACVEHVRAGAASAPIGPVAVIAQDRTLVRRMCALLAPAGIRVADETGWKLSTSRAAAAVLAWLRAAQPRASSDDLLDALTSGWAIDPADDATLESPAPSARARAVAMLESHLRRTACRRAWDMAWTDERATEPSASSALPDGLREARQLWLDTQHALLPLNWSGRLPLSQALRRLAQALKALGAWTPLAEDEAGRQVLAALRLGDEAGAEAEGAWALATDAVHVDAAGLQTWVDRVLEQVSFLPAPPLRPEVVITPMAKAAMRPFTDVVWPAMDDARLAEAEPTLAWLGDAMAAKLGLPTRADLHEQTWQALSHVMAGQPVHVSWRHQDAGRPLGPSPWWERWLAVCGQHRAEAASVRQAQDSRALRRVSASPTPWPAPGLSLRDAASGALMLWPKRLNASSYEYLRSCPYRFFAHAVLGLREDNELEEGVDARDFGTWLHELLRRFHGDEASVHGDARVALERLRAIAQELRASAGWDSVEAAPDFLPYAAALHRLLPAYVDWWIAHRDAGARVQGLESALEGQTPELRELGVLLKGQLDRVDLVKVDSGDGHGAGEHALILDYKTTSLQRLQARMRPTLEDTQLAFYAALLMLQAPTGDAPGTGDAGLRAAYLSLEDRRVELAEHKNVMDSAEQMLDGITHDMRRLAQGHPMRALGEGEVCDFCAARGLCRKDDWPDGEQPVVWEGRSDPHQPEAAT